MSEKGLVLVVDDDVVTRVAARHALAAAGYSVEEAETGDRGIVLFRQQQPDAVLLDVRMPGLDGYATCRQLRSLPSARHTPILIMSGVEDLDASERAFAAGATDFEIKPLHWRTTLHRISYMLKAAEAEAAAARHIEDAAPRRPGRAGTAVSLEKEPSIRFDFRSPEMAALVEIAERVAPTEATVLITGESGTGKELLARTLHRLSPRREHPLVIVDCGAIPPSLIESELFGHEKGSFTGASTRRVGRLAEAAGTTLFLDEIGELPLEVQSKLLRFVQERQVRAIGSRRVRDVDVRILAATNRDLTAEVRTGRFREDLFHRLNVINLRIPPLRDRPADILHLAYHSLGRYAKEYRRHVTGLSPEAEQRLGAHPWPGNVRELQNRILQAVILCEGPQIEADDLKLPRVVPTRITEPWPTTSEEPHRPAPVASEPSLRPRSPKTATVDGLLEELEVELGTLLDELCEKGARPPVGRWLGNDLVASAMSACEGVIRQAAILVGLPESTFRRRLEKVQAGSDGDRVEDWDAIWHLLERLVEANRARRIALCEVTERRLLEQLVEKLPGQVKRGAALLGVSAPTYRSRIAALTSS